MALKSILALAIGISFVGCAAAPASSSKPAEVSSSAPVPQDYVPLAVGNAWTYEARSGKSIGSDTVRIVGQDGRWFLDDHRGRMRYDDLGLRDADRYLLRSPIEAGKSWSSVEQMALQRFEITAVDATLQTPAGKFSNCVVVRNEEPLAQGGKFVTEWTYAPQTGLALLRTRVLTPDGKDTEQLRLTLTKFERAP